MKKYTIYFTLLFTCLCCSWNGIQNDVFIYQKNNQKLVLRLENGHKHLNWEEKTNFTITVENIDSKSLSLSAPGLRLLKGASNQDKVSLWEVTPKRENLSNDTLTVFISGQDLKKAYWSHKFKIPVH